MTHNETFEEQARKLMSDRNFPIRITNTKKKIFYSEDEVIEFMSNRNATVLHRRNAVIFVYNDEEHSLRVIPKRLRDIYVCQR
jgi:hypothetical protein